MATSDIVVCYFVVICLLLLQPGFSQSIVDSKFCEDLHCGAPGGPNSEKYCCAESNGYTHLLKCCNPYIGLTIGLCIGVPLIILIIVGVVVMYCVCANYHNRKMARLARIQSRNRRRAERNTVVQAPPQYTPTDPTKPSDSDLPLYSVTDPYASLQPVPVQSLSPPSQEPSDHTPPEDTHSEDCSNQQATVVVSEDVPLLPFSDEQS